MTAITFFMVIWLGVGFIYALWVWLFHYAPFTSILWNTLLGFPYILYTIYLGFNIRKPDLHFLFKGKKAVIFDMDGTIVDTHDIWDQAMEEIKKEMGLEDVQVSPAAVSGLHTRDKWIEVLANAENRPSVNVEDLVQQTKQKFLELIGDIKVVDGFWSFAKYLKQKGYKIALASNTDRGVVMEVVKKLEAQNVFDTIVGGDEVKNKKPASDIYKKVLKQLNISSNQAVIFEDSIAGTRAAVAAKVPTIVREDPDIPRILYPIDRVDFFIDDFTGLEELIDRSPKERASDLGKRIDEKYNDTGVSEESSVERTAVGN